MSAYDMTVSDAIYGPFCLGIFPKDVLEKIAGGMRVGRHGAE